MSQGDRQTPGRVAGTEPSNMSIERLSLLTKVAVMYHEQGIRQPEIADRLHISQSRVSRFLKEAVGLGIVRTVVVSPPGVYTDLESRLVDRFGLADAVVVDPFSDDEPVVLRALGAAAATYLGTTLVNEELVGISSWSATLLAAVEAMQPKALGAQSRVVQVIGGSGQIGAQVMATQMVERLSKLLSAKAVYLHAPGIVDSADARRALLSDTAFAPVVNDWSKLSLLLVGIGALEPSALLHDSGNSLGESELARLRSIGAVGDVCLRFFDKDGVPVESELDSRVVGIGVDELLAVPRKIGVAGGARKVDAIRAAATGGWIDVLITDLSSASALVD